MSRRMQKLASLVTEGNRLADVGTDHGYIPIALVQAGKIPSAIAMDVNRGPLARAEAHIREAGLATYIETRLSDGLRELGAEDADTVLIAGMGGMLILRILTEGIPHLSGVEELILQPQSDVYRVRDWLQKHGYRVETEELVEEDGKYYPMMRASADRSAGVEQAELYYGKAGGAAVAGGTAVVSGDEAPGRTEDSSEAGGKWKRGYGAGTGNKRKYENDRLYVVRCGKDL